MGRTFQDHKTRVDSLDSEAVLGRLCWYTVTEAHVPWQTVADALKTVGLDAHTPPQPKDDDVFRRVCSSVQRKKVPTNDGDIFENFLVRDVVRSGGTVVKHIVVERVDKKGRRLHHEELIRVEYREDSIHQEWIGLATMRHDTALEIGREINTRFVAERGSMNAYGIREMIRKLLLSLNATVVRPGGGVYFVMEDRHAVIEALASFSELVDNVFFHDLKLEDEKKQRDMLRKAFEAETIEEVERLIEEIGVLRQELRRSGKAATAEQKAKFASKQKELADKTKGYSGLLEQNLTSTNFKLKLLRQEVQALMKDTPAKVPEMLQQIRAEDDDADDSEGDKPARHLQAVAS